jgi:MurNAc alpha-1-phosphate uridylyltransferase
MQAVVLAGGLATRMRPRTERVPKSLLEVAGRPFVDWQLELLAGAGLRQVVLCIAHLGQAIVDHVGDGSRHGVTVRYARETGPDGKGQLLGTAGALRAALPLLEPRFLVTYGDSYLPFDYAAPLVRLAEHPDCDGVMSVYGNADRYEGSNVATDGAWVLRYDKRRTPIAGGPALDHIDYGAIALRREVIAALPPGVPLGLDAISEELAVRGRLRAFVVHERFFEIGSPEGWAALDLHLRKAPSP